jgi:YD repeat-containing protein
MTSIRVLKQLLTRFEANEFGTATLVIDALGRRTTTETNDAGLPTRIERANGAVTKLKYDEERFVSAADLCLPQRWEWPQACWRPCKALRLEKDSGEQGQWLAKRFVI